jgi:hypothetical protein
MKRILPLLILFVFCAGMVQAQRLRDTDDHLDKQVLAVAVTGPQMAIMEMERELKLTKEQLAQVEQLNENRFQLMAEAEATIEDPLKLQRQYRDIQVKLDKVLANILTESQLKHYLELEGRQNIQFLSGKEDEE